MLKKDKTIIQIDCKKIYPPNSQPLVAVYEAHLDMTFNTSSEERLKAIVGQLSSHLSPVSVRKMGRRFELIAGYREFHLAQKFDVTSLTAVVIDDMPAEEMFEFSVIGCVLPLLEFDTKPSTATNAQFRSFYQSLRKNLDKEFKSFLRQGSLADLLNIPASQRRGTSTAKQSALERQRAEVKKRLKKEQVPTNTMSKFSLRDLHTRVEPSAMESEDWLNKTWVQYLSKEQIDLLKGWLSDSSRERIQRGRRHV